MLASQAAIAVTNARLYEQLGQESAALARQTDSQRRLLEINRSSSPRSIPQASSS